mmetsp:Transcript_101482/g.262931  ORF Transcript_101482/g.262931 Transcript_101482/m.262931 type:complete len:196 (-) Transcript_101482:94-681(-)
MLTSLSPSSWSWEIFWSGACCHTRVRHDMMRGSDKTLMKGAHSRSSSISTFTSSVASSVVDTPDFPPPPDEGSKNPSSMHGSSDCGSDPGSRVSIGSSSGAVPELVGASRSMATSAVGSPKGVPAIGSLTARASSSPPIPKPVVKQASQLQEWAHRMSVSVREQENLQQDRRLSCGRDDFGPLRAAELVKPVRAA